MKVNRGDIVLADYPFASGGGSKLRPVLVLQDDYYNARIANVIVANITSNLKNRHDKGHFLIDVSTPEGAQSGLHGDSLVSCINLATIRADRIQMYLIKQTAKPGQSMAYVLRMTGAVIAAILCWALAAGILFLLAPGFALGTMFAGLVLFLVGADLEWRWTAATGGILMFAGVFVAALVGALN
jgi:mRNA-degrading endonuclease toxin of MazEF toxin-antitoxin module